MSETDELRRILDERGVEWWQSANTLGCIFTRWYSPLFGDEVCAMENGDEGLVLFDHYLTPAQAIAATVGRGTCQMECAGRPTERTLDVMGMYFCSKCGSPIYNDCMPSYCIYCGAEVTL